MAGNTFAEGHREGNKNGVSADLAA